MTKANTTHLFRLYVSLGGGVSLCLSIVGISARIWFVMSAQEDVGPKETGMGVVDLGKACQQALTCTIR